MHQPPIPQIDSSDPEIAGLIHGEARRQAEKMRLIPSENYVSLAVLEACGTVLTNKYSEGYPGKRYYEGQQFIDPLETLAIERAKSLFGVDHANVQPYSGSPGNLAVYLAFAQPGDTVMGMSLPMGGHLTHGAGVAVGGKWFHSVQYGVRRDTGRIDFDEVRDLARKERPKIIFAGGTAVPRTIDFPAFAEIAAETGAVLVADIAHIAGLIAGGAHPSPVGHAHVITTTTHKTLRGPRGAMIMTDAAHASAIDKAVFPGLQGGPHNHTTAGIAVALREAAQPSFREYAAQVVSNAAALASALRARGFDLVSGGTDNHLLLADLTSKGIGGKPAAKALDRAGIELNFNTVPFDPRRPFDPSGIRLGTPAITTRGLGESHMPQLAAWIDEAVTAAAKDDEAALDRVAAEVRDLLAGYPIPGWSPEP
jgi:glycine hydroxymethyltransferase